MLTIYHLDNSRSERIVWLCEELALPYQQKTFLRHKGLAPAEMKAIHPLGKAPLLGDGELVIMESGAIVEYILNRYGNGRLVPAMTSPAYGLYLQWLHAAEGSAMSDLLGELRVKRALGEAAEASPHWQGIHARNVAMLEYIDGELGKHPYLAGDDFTAADIMMEFNFSFMTRLPKTDYSRYRNVLEWLERVRSRPAYQRMTSVAAPQVPF